MDEDICNWMPEVISCVIADGKYIPADEVEFIDIEESFEGRDVMTFKYEGKIRKSEVVTKYI